MLKKIFVFTFLLTVYSSHLLAYAPVEGNVSSYFGPYLFKTNFDSAKTDLDSFSTGIGLVVLGDINQQGSIEIGMYHFYKTYFREQLGNLIAEKTPLIQVNMGYRSWISETFSAAVTLSSAYSMGSIERIYSDFTPGSEIETSARDNTEYGMDVSVLKEVFKNEKMNILLDARYSFSLTSKAGESGDHFALMLALNYLLQQKDQ